MIWSLPAIHNGAELTQVTDTGRGNIICGLDTRIKSPLLWLSGRSRESTTLAELGNRAVIEHDLNIYRALLALGRAGCADRAA